MPRKTKRRFLLLAAGTAVLALPVFLNPYPRQRIFGPRIRGIPLCVWQNDFRDTAAREPERREDTFLAKILAWLQKGRPRDEGLEWESLSHAEDEAIILGFVDDPDAMVRSAVAQRLSRRESKETFDALLVLLGDPMKLVREPAERGLDLAHTMAENPLGRMTTFMRTADSDGRARALKIIEWTWPSQSDRLPLLLSSLDDPDSGVRATACDLLSTAAWKRRRMARAAVPKLMERLADRDTKCCLAAATAIFNITQQYDSVVPVYRAGVQSQELSIRLKALNCLHATGKGAVAAWDEIVHCALSDPDPSAKQAAIWALGNGGGKAVPALLTLVKDKDSQVQSWALFVLSQLGPEAKEAAPYLLSHIRELGDAAYFSLAAMKATDAIPLLLDALNEENQTADMTVRLLGELGGFGPAAAPAAPKLTRFLQASDRRTQLAAALCLAKIGDEAKLIVPILLDHLRDQDLLSFSALEGLCALGPLAKDAVPPLIAHRRSANVNRHYATIILASIGPPAESAIPELLPLLDSNHIEEQLITVKALGKIHRDPLAVVPRLVPFLDDKYESNWQFRITVVEALAQFGPEAYEAVPALRRLIDNDDEELADAAISALTAIDPARYPKK